MALLEVSIYSEVLALHTHVKVILPTPLNGPKMAEIPYYDKNMRYQTLYLLHGATANETIWTRFTNIEWWAQEHCLAVVMPAANNSFYCNMAHGADYLKFYTEELPVMMEGLFPLSGKREDRFIAGNSMGGYGALRIALEKPEYFSHCCSMSAALDFEGMLSGKEPCPGLSENAFGGKEQFFGSDNDLLAIFVKRVKEGKKLPRFYACCGTEDSLLHVNREFAETLKSMKADICYREKPGNHNWIYWNEAIQDVISWLPLKNTLV